MATKKSKGTKTTKKVKPDPSKLTADEALALLLVNGKGKNAKVHSLMGTSFALLGCDMMVTSIKNRFKTSKDIRLSGDNATKMGHGVAYHDTNDDTYVFLETDNDKLTAIYKKRKIKK